MEPSEKRNDTEEMRSPLKYTAKLAQLLDAGQISFGSGITDDRIYGGIMMTKLNVVAKSDGGPGPAANVHPLRKLGTLLKFSENVKGKCAKDMSERNNFSFGARSASGIIPIGFQMELEESKFKRSILSAGQVNGYNEIDREAIEIG